jgi:amino acid adenylation domain-containing protein
MTQLSDPGTASLTPESEADVYVLAASFAQGRLWFLYQLEPQSTAYNIDVALRMFGAFRLDALEAAWVALVSRHEALRTTLAQEGSEPVQVVHPPKANFPIEFVTLEQTPEDKREDRLRRLIADIGRRPFDLERGPLLRVTVVQLGAEEHVLVMSMHHAVSDGWSLGILLRELGVLYGAALQTPPEHWVADVLIKQAALEALPVQYADYAEWQRDWLSGDEMKRQEDFWLGQLNGELPTLALSTDRPRPLVQGHDGATYRFHLSPEVSTGLNALARTSNSTLYMTLLAVYGAFFHRYTGDDDFVVGSPIAGRTRSETEGLIGMFVNTLALRVDVSGDPTFRQLLGRVREMMIGAYAHQEFPFDRLVFALQPPRDRSRSPIFQSMFDLQNTRETSGETTGTFGNLRASRVPSPATTAKFDLQMSFNEGDEGLRGVIIYPTDLFDEATIARMAEHFGMLAAAIVANPEAPVSRLDMLPAHERALVVDQWNRTDTPYDTTATLTGLLAAQAARSPDAIALVHEGRELTYAELGRRSDCVAHRLRQLGVTSETRVGICLSRGMNLLIAILGVLKAGGAYVPLDPAYPKDRNAFVLEQTGATALITEKALAADFEQSAVRLLFIDALAAPMNEQIELPTVNPSDLAYIIYTSGSTGRPKGIAVEHGTAVAFMAWSHATYSRDELAAVLFGSSACFDMSVFEIFATLTCGGSLIIAENALALPDLPDRNRITLVNTVPSAMTALLRLNAVPASVCTVNLCGELAPTSLVAQLYALKTVKRVYDVYGPSEDTVYTTWALRHPQEPPTIGRPIANEQVYVLDQHREPLPIGVPGELYIGGAGVARGYYGRPDLTAERFVSNPFATGATGARMFRTGDRGRWRRDGRLEFLGRLDHQVKIRGFRVEPGEVQACIEAVNGVRDAAVVVREDNAGDKRLVGYFDSKPGAAVTSAHVLIALRALLPAYMVPSTLMQLEAMPRTPSGKLDRRALPAPEFTRDEGVRPYKAPRSNVEHELVQIWEQLLPGKQISIYDDFFEVGGHSLLAVQMLAEVERMRGRRVPLAWLFESSTIETLAARLSAEAIAHKEPALVVLQPEATGMPVAFVHGDVRGGGWYCRRLAPLAAPDSPVYLLGTVGIDSELLPWTIEAMARIHLAELRKALPHGPYRIGGFCVGGLIAFEMALQLQAIGEVVERLIIVDTAAVNVHVRPLRPLLALVPGSDANERMTRQAVLMTRLRWYELRIRQVRRQPMGKRLEWVATNVSRRWRRLFSARAAGDGSARTKQGQVSHDAQTKQFASALRTQIAAGPGASVLLMQARAASLYFPGHFRGCIDLIWANDKPGVRKIDPTRGWGHYADSVRVHPIFSTHLGLVTNDLPKLAEALRSVLARVGE